MSVRDLDRPATLPQLLGEHYISTLMFMLWQLRPDLQRAFDLKTEAGQRDFSHWYRVSAQREYGLPPELPSYGAFRANLAPRQRPGIRKWFGRLLRLGRQPPDRVAAAPRGANLVGYANAEMGMGEHVRMSAAALATTGMPFGVVNLNVDVPARQEATLSHGKLMRGSRFGANVFHVNADQMFNAYCHLGRDFFARRYNIGYWAWELAKCPDEWLPVIEMIDEIWAPSRFIQRAFAERTGKPVTYMPLCVSLPEVREFTRADFGLPQGHFLFLYTFDFLSYIERKNPFAAIRAFRQAFPDRAARVGLVLKVLHGDVAQPQWLRMLALIDGDPRIFVLNETMVRRKVIGLYNVCDCFLSLHRSEGFGRGPAEAMYLGKPVVVTNYSGNTDFTLAGNACLVDYRLVAVQKGQYVLERDQVWAEPDLGHAAKHMEKLAGDPVFARELAARGQAYVRRTFSPEAIGAIYADRLAQIGASPAYATATGESS